MDGCKSGLKDCLQNIKKVFLMLLVSFERRTIGRRQNTRKSKNNFKLRAVRWPDEKCRSIRDWHDFVDGRLGGHPSGFIHIIFFRFKLTIIFVYSTKHNPDEIKIWKKRKRKNIIGGAKIFLSSPVLWGENEKGAL